jgi:hypothetical protein
VNSPLSDQLCLRSIPEWVVCIGTLKLLESVNVGPLITRVLAKSLQGLRRERVKLIIVLSNLAKIEARLSPGDDLIQERFGRLASTPPTGAAARGMY